MDAATITALCTGVAAILGAITALIIALDSHGRSTAAGSFATQAVSIARTANNTANLAHAIVTGTNVDVDPPKGP